MNRKNRAAAGIAAALLLSMLCLPAVAHAAADATDAQTLAEALAAGESPVTFATDITTSGDLSVSAATVVNLEGHAWTVAGGTVVVSGTVTGGTLLAGAGGTVRVPVSVALENVNGSETIRSVTYQDGGTDSAAGHIGGVSISAGSAATLNLKTASGTTPRALRGVTTNAGSYRLGSSTGRLSRVYGITYDLDGGRLAPGANPADYTASDAAFTLVNPTRQGYLFAGWTGTGLSTPTMRVTVAENSSGERSYTATWDEDPAAQRMPGGGGSGGRGGLSISTGTDADEASAEPAAEPAAANSAATGQESRRRVSVASSSTKVTFSDGTDAFATMDEMAAQGAPQQSQPRIPWPLLGLVAVVAGVSGLLLHGRRKKK